MLDSIHILRAQSLMWTRNFTDLAVSSRYTLAQVIGPCRKISQKHLMENRIIEFDLYYMYLNENMARSQNDKPILVLYTECV